MKVIIKQYLFLLLMVFAISACAQGTSTSGFTPPDEAWKLINNGALLLDVRTSGEFSQGHIKGAQHIPHTQVSARLAELDPDKDRPVVLYCAAGVRAEKARKVLQKAGYTHIYNARGYSDLVTAKH